MHARRAQLIAVLGAVLVAARVAAQPAAINSHAQGYPQNKQLRNNANPDAALEITPRAGSLPPQANTTPSVPSDADNVANPADQELPPLPTSGPPLSMVSGAPPRPSLPYIGLSVQRIESHARAGRDVLGLEIVSVDPGSPAERAGLRGRGGMTELGASGATAGALLAPLDIALMPLLKKTGQLGQTGDLIIAVDDRRVTGEIDLETALADSKPGDMIYLTVVRPGTNGTHQTIKTPVTLGDPPSAH
jgi:hypothetical protein